MCCLCAVGVCVYTEQTVICGFVAVAVAMVVAIVRFQNYLYVHQSDVFTIVGLNYTPVISTLLLVMLIEVRPFYLCTHLLPLHPP